jgi:hypothetical protein
VEAAWRRRVPSRFDRFSSDVLVETRRAFQSRGNRFRLHVKRAPCGDIATQPHHLDEFKPRLADAAFTGAPATDDHEPPPSRRTRRMVSLPRGSEITVILAQPTRSAYARFLVFSARTGADREGRQRVEISYSAHAGERPLLTQT